MGLADNEKTLNQAPPPVPGTDLSRPPRLSRRERSYYCFYFELSGETLYLLPRLTKYVLSYGARYSAFLDINVTHIVSDKPASAIQASLLAQKIGARMISLSDFLQKIVESYERMNSQSILAHPFANAQRLIPVAHARPPLSPTLKRAAEECGCRNLGHMLAEEKNKANASMARLGRPLYNTAGGTPSLSKTNRSAIVGQSYAGTSNGISTTGRIIGYANERKVIHLPFSHPFIVLEEANHAYSPVYKEYQPDPSGRNSFPTLYWVSPEFHCPWIFPRIANVDPDQIIAANMEIKIPCEPRRPRHSQVPMVLDAEDKSLASICRQDLLKSSKKHLLAIKARSNHSVQSVKGLGLAPVPNIPKNALSASGGRKSSVNATTVPITSGNDKTTHRPRPGFCECCYEKYSNLEAHVASSSHRNIARSEETYRVVDRVIASLVRVPLDTLHKSAGVQALSVVQEKNAGLKRPTNGSDTELLFQNVAQNNHAVSPVSPAKSNKASNELTMVQRQTFVGFTANPSLATIGGPLRNITNHTPGLNYRSLKFKENMKSSSYKTNVLDPLNAAKPENMRKSLDLMYRRDNEEKPDAAETVLIELGSDSPLYSSPSFKRRRSERLSGRSLSARRLFVET